MISRKLLLVALLGSLVTCQASVVKQGPGWNYEDQSSWPSGPEACGGEKQSPINIDTSTVVVDTAMPPLEFDNYDKRFPQFISNNGHTVVLELGTNDQGDSFPSIKGGGLNSTYIFQQLHFHWGVDNSRGSEHRINDYRFSAELHMVHYNAKYGNFSMATQHTDGLAVLGMVIEIEKRDNIAFRHIDQFDQIMHPDGDPVSQLENPILLEDLLPDSISGFFRYQGSLTTPNCNQVVTWTLFDTPIALSARQLKMFRALFDDEGQTLADNFRGVQPLNGRIVTYRSADGQRPSTPSPAPTSGAGSMTGNSILIWIILSLFVRKYYFD